MAITDIILRIVNNPPLTTKNAELTWAELDGNFVDIYDYVTDMNTGGGVPSFGMATAYTGTKYVSYNGKIWVHVAAGTSTGVVPGTNPAVWVEVTIGAIAHVQNTDTKLAEGTANEVTAANIADAINTPVQSVTKSQLNTAITGGTLRPGKRYRVTNAFTWGEVIVEAITVDAIANTGTIVAQLPDTGQTATGHVWIYGAGYAINALVAWDGYMYRNKTNANGTNPPPSDTTNWELKTDATYYVDYSMDAQFTFNGTNFTVISLMDAAKRNYHGGADIGLACLPALTPNSTDNWADPHSDTGQLARVMGPVMENTWVACIMAMPKGGELTIRGNRGIGSKINIQVPGNGTIIDNTIINTELKWPGGIYTGMIMEGMRFEFDQLTPINIRPAFYETLGRVTTQGSTIIDSIDFTGGGTLDLATNGYPDVYGVIVLTTTNVSETLTGIENGTRKFPLIIKPDAGVTIDVAPTSGATPATNAVYVDGGAVFTLIGDNGDFMKVEPITVGGTDGWVVTQKHVLA